MTDRNDSYVKEYFEDNYSEQFASMRAQYRSRTKNALLGRKIDEEPIANATTIVYLHDDDQGGYSITTGDFVEHFNRRFGDSDRIGAMQRSIANAVRRDEMRREVEERHGVGSGRKKQKEFAPLRSVRHRFALLQVVFSLMLVFSVGILGVTAVMVDQSKAEVMQLEEEVAMLEATHGVGETDQYDNTTVVGDQSGSDLSGEDSVELYPATNGGGVEMAGLLNALANLGK